MSSLALTAVIALSVSVSFAQTARATPLHTPSTSGSSVDEAGVTDPPDADAAGGGSAKGTVPSVAASDPRAAGPEISFILPRPFPFVMNPEIEPGKRFVIEVVPITFGVAMQDRLRALLHAEMTKYPSGTLGAVQLILIGSQVRFNTRSVGGIHFLGMVFIAVGDGEATEEGDAHFTRAFHHETAHALFQFHQSRFDAARFRAALPDGFAYADEQPGAQPPAEVAFDPRQDQPSLDLLRDGFLVPWAKDRMEEDFASYAEVLMRDPRLLLDTFAPDSRVGRKARVVRDFYIAIDPRFAAFFEKGPAPHATPQAPER